MIWRIFAIFFLEYRVLLFFVIISNDMPTSRPAVHKISLIFVCVLSISFAFLACRQDAKESSKKDRSAPVVSYQEAHRPQFHFSPATQWMNDPNGMVFYEGEYHLFYQYYPDSNVWGPMHWGHAVSEDLVHWKHLPIALYPDELGYIFSGSAVVDWPNSSGLGKDGAPPIVAIFTHHDPHGEKSGSDTFQVQSIAYSNDRGRTWTKYLDNPVVKNPGIRDFRDPKVFWHDESQHWIMVFAAKDRVRIYNSPNLRSWTFQSEFGLEHGNHGGVWECPDLFELPTGDGGGKWVLLVSINPGGPNGGSATQYFIGEFDGERFKNDNPPSREMWVDWGKDNYAGVTFSGIDQSDRRRVFMGWMSNWQYAQVVPTTIWRSAMTIPRQLGLVNLGGDVLLTSKPVREMRRLRQEAVTISKRAIAADLNLLSSFRERTGLYEVHLSFEKPPSGKIKIELANGKGEFLQVGYNADQNEYFIDRLTSGLSEFSQEFSGIHVAPCHYEDRGVQMTMYVDRSSIELFADEGKTVMTEIFFPSEPFDDLKIIAPKQGDLILNRASLYTLKGIWELDH